MRFLIRSSLLFDGFKLYENVELTIEGGLVYFNARSGSYDREFDVQVVIPGFIDSHVHLIHEYRPNFLTQSIRNMISLFLIHGVVVVRDTGNYLSIKDLFYSVSEDLEISQTYTVEQPPLSWAFMRAIKTIDDIPVSVSRAKIEGCRWFKLYNNVDPTIAEKAVIESKNKGLKTTCHLDSIGLLNAIEMGFDMVEHLATIPFLTPQTSDKSRYSNLLTLWEELDEGTIEDVGKRMAEKNIAVSTTLALLRGFIGNLKIDKRKHSRYITAWYKYYKIKNREWSRVYHKILRAVRILWENNVKIVAGTDIPNQALTPGLSLWEELDILQEAGLDMWDSIKTATGIASVIIGSERGRIIDGGFANILLLSKIPHTISDLMSIESIILGDKIIEVENLKNQLKKIPLFGM